jgi:predicted HicB family RNase H-like nuclease
MVNVNIEIPDEIHKKAKLKSVMKNITLKEYIIKAVEEKLKQK